MLSDTIIIETDDAISRRCDTHRTIVFTPLGYSLNSRYALQNSL